MRIVIISVPSTRSAPSDLVKSLAKGIESMGHRVDILDAWTEDGVRLPGYEYIIVVGEAVSFFSGKIPDALSKVLSSASSLSGKKSAAFLKKGGLFQNKALSNIMRAMENEGMFVNWSDILLNASHAEAMGKRIGNER
jgi:menaquinone-dependent protoporphyrinogen IX oxidase